MAAKIKRIIGTFVIILVAVGLAGCGSGDHHSASRDDQHLVSLNYQSGHSAIVKVDHDHSTLDPGKWKSDHVKYANLDDLNRTSKGNTAYLARPNVAHDTLRTRQFIYPSGWHQKMVGNQPILNRGHLIAYSLSKGIDYQGHYRPANLSGDQNNPRNLFTQTAFSNQKLQTIYESKVRHALYHNKKVIFEVKPIFRGHELMARGVHMQAVSTDHSLDFNVYLFNVQPGIKFDYATGRSVIDQGMRIPIPKNAPVFRNDYFNGRMIRYHDYRYHPVSPRHFHRRKLIVNE